MKGEGEGEEGEWKGRWERGVPCRPLTCQTAERGLTDLRFCSFDGESMLIGHVGLMPLKQQLLLSDQT